MTEQVEVSTDEELHAPPNRPLQWIAGFAIPGAVTVGVIIYYSTEVCDQQLTQAGSVVNVCRRLQIADPPMALVGLAVLVALTAFFSEISGFGISLKRDVQRANRTASEAKSRSMFAESAAQSARQSSQVAEDLSIGAAGAHGDRHLRGPDGLLAEVDRMASEYNQIRQNEQRSAPRTSKMTTIASNMIASLNGVGQDVFDVTAYLDDHSNDGRRLAAYAYLYANPDPRLAQHLTDAVLIDSTSFGQYWGIRALRRLIATDPAAIDLNTRRRLEQFLAGLGPSTDRAFELRELLCEAETGPRA